MKILIIQTAFLGDVILATPIIERLKEQGKDYSLDFLLRKGNESVLLNHPHLNKVLIYDKKNSKYTNLIRILKEIRKERYDYVININRFFTAGLITVLSGSKNTVGFNKNPFSFLFSRSLVHRLDQHEVERNLSLISTLAGSGFRRPQIYPSATDFERVKTSSPYICLAPATVWFTKQLPAEKWCELIRKLPGNLRIYLVGSESDFELCEQIRTESNHPMIENLAGKLSLLQSAALIKNTRMTVSNDSTPVHLASSMNAPLIIVYCSTIPGFGFGPLSEDSVIMETDKVLACRPCGLHGKRKCKEGHFACSDMDMDKIASLIKSRL